MKIFIQETKAMEPIRGSWRLEYGLAGPQWPVFCTTSGLGMGATLGHRAPCLIRHPVPSHSLLGAAQSLQMMGSPWGLLLHAFPCQHSGSSPTSPMAHCNQIRLQKPPYTPTLYWAAQGCAPLQEPDIQHLHLSLWR